MQYFDYLSEAQKELLPFRKTVWKEDVTGQKGEEFFW